MEPLATIVSDAVLPALIVDELGCAIIPGRTKIVESAESTLPKAFEIRTQYVSVSVSAGVVKVGELMPTGLVVTPKAP